MRSLASITLALVAWTPLLSACGDDVTSTDSLSAPSSTSGSATTEPGTSTSTSDPGTTTGDPTTTAPTTTPGTTTSTTDTETATTTTGPATETGVTSETTDATTGEPPAVCCEPTLCGDPAIEACVCTVDASCCQGPWTSQCVALVTELGCGSCPPPPEGPCCEAGVGPGCSDDAVEGCVCLQLPDCCAGAWGPECVAAVDSLGCGVCVEPPKGECCAAHRGGGCLDAGVESCVCAVAPECCADVWTEACVALVDEAGCGMCEEEEKTACCTPGDGPGCSDPTIEACVCAQDPFCCQAQWDGACVQKVDQLGCGTCQPELGDCCQAGEGPGCVDPAVQACVCNTAPGCCQDLWSADCVGLVDALGCGTCEPPAPGPCCEAHDTPSCDDAAVAACVCAQDDLCCTASWTEQCVAEVDAFGCGTCEPPAEAPCCAEHDTPSCDDAAVSECVCAEDPFCCAVEWDGLCVAEVETLGCGTCGGQGGTGCCEEHDSAACDDAAVSECVCAEDPFCCSVEWDSLCVAEVETLGCGTCE